MKKTPRETEFIKSVKNRFNIYNSLFLSLPFRKIQNIGNLIPLLNHECRKGLESGKEPLEILDTFFRVHTTLESEEEKIDFMFRVIQYVERQVVLYDSVEDAAFDRLLKLGKHLSLTDCTDMACLYQSTSTLVKKMSDFSVRIVFTAHPTQFYPRSVLDIIENLRSLVRENKIDEIELSLQQLGLTSLMNARKPTPLDEAKNIIYFLRSVYYDAVGDLYAYIKEHIPADGFENPEIIQLGFWPGGDRDGNPFVTSETTALVADELRMTLMKCYYDELKGLQQKLTFKEVVDHITKLKDHLYAAIFDPLRTLSVTEMLDQLNRVKELVRERFNGMYMESLERFIDKIKIFKTHPKQEMISRKNHGR